MIEVAMFCLLLAGTLSGLYVGHAIGYQEGVQDHWWDQDHEAGQ